VPVAQPLRIEVPVARLWVLVRPWFSLQYHGPLWKGQTAGSTGVETGISACCEIGILARRMLGSGDGVAWGCTAFRSRDGRRMGDWTAEGEDGGQWAPARALLFQ